MKSFKRIAGITVVTSLLLALLLGSLFGMGFSRPAQAAPEQVSTYNPLLMLSAIGITQTVNGSAVSVPVYDFADCYLTVDVTSLQTVTVKLQHSYAGSNWVDGYTFPAVSADGTSFTRTLVYGGSNRAIVSSLGTTNTVDSIRVVCDFKRN